MEHRGEIIDIYRKYGFKYHQKESSEWFLVFTYKSGFFHNAEIIYINNQNSAELTSIEKDLNKLGYSVKKSLFKSLDILETALFEGFFEVDIWKEKIKNLYCDYTKKIQEIVTENNINKYEYISVDYTREEKNNIKIGEVNIIESLINDLNGRNPKLIIIEAPAGFGKTSTSYEFINKLVETEDKPLPFFTEFDRDRQAKIFNHIFHREVNTQFRSVSSSLVIDETKKGKIVLVLDGFDELLNESSSHSPNKDFEQTQPMLETISDLLEGSAKIILTSRRSAMFDSEIFKDWEDNHNSNFNVIRYRLTEPTIKNWLNSEKLNILKESNIVIEQLSNPVVLTYLRAIKTERLKELCTDNVGIINYYFKAMLEREKERQYLLMSHEEQSIVLTKIANDMCLKNYTSESKDNLVFIIKDNCLNILENTRLLYPARDRPSIDELANKLATHAFIDKSSSDPKKLHFINEFVFGNYIAEAILNNDGNEWLADEERFIEPPIMSYLPRSSLEKENLWDKLNFMRGLMRPSDLMKYEGLLLKKINDIYYDNQMISYISIADCQLFDLNEIKSTVFNQCLFKNSHFNFKNFYDITFINCKFYNCTYDKNDKNIKSFTINFLNCSDDNEFIKLIESYEVLDLELPESEQLEKEILLKFIQKGSNTFQRLHIYTGVLYQLEHDYPRRIITKAIKNLKEKNILENASNSSFTALNKNMISDVKRLLGKVST